MRGNMLHVEAFEKIKQREKSFLMKWVMRVIVILKCIIRVTV